MLTRRQFLAAGASVAAAGVGTLLYAWRVEPHWVDVVRRPMPLEGLPPELVGRTLLQVSDIHVGPNVSSAYLIRVFDEDRDLAPDYVALTGDFVSYRSARDLTELSRVLRHLPRGRHATVGSLGNHDYGLAWRELDVADGVARAAADAGVEVLRNEVRTIGGLQFAGLADFWSPEFGRGLGRQPAGLFPPTVPDSTPAFDAGAETRAMDAVGAISAIVPGRPTVVLSHNPDVQDEPIWRGVRGWVLAGHTHGGQVKPPFLPPPVLPVRNRRYTSGAFTVGPGRTLYVNRGLGHLVRVRLNVRPELTLFTLQRASPAGT